jgi:tRNA-splicing ligase RtcB
MEEKYGFKNLPDRELINAPIKSQLGKEYFSAMACAANFAFANKQIITHWVREEMKYLFPKFKADVIYDVCHNIAKFEKHKVNTLPSRSRGKGIPNQVGLKEGHNASGKIKEVCVHRKGATRSFGPGRKEVPVKYRKVGQPVIIPGSMGTSSYILVGTKKAEELTWGSTVHGAGRVKSRSKAFMEIKSEEVKKELEKKGIEVKSGSLKSLVSESPEVYKDIDEIVRVVDELGINKKVARLRPLCVIKG